MLKVIKSYIEQYCWEGFYHPSYLVVEISGTKKELKSNKAAEMVIKEARKHQFSYKIDVEKGPILDDCIKDYCRVYLFHRRSCNYVPKTITQTKTQTKSGFLKRLFESLA